jgi:catechol 2,3-dioxygenase-like lactoylglutathione lyase family enzyme
MEHVGLGVADLERSIAFYRDVLGFRLARVIECPPEMRLGDIVALPGCRARIAHMQTDTGMLELFEYADPRGRPVPPDRTQADAGFSHLGISSTDVRADYERLCAAGVRFLHAPVEFRPGVWIAYFSGPDGEVCEIRQS